MKKTLFGAVTALAIFVGVRVDAAPIHDAARDGDLAGVEQQLRNNVDVNLVDVFRNTALMLAAWAGDTEIVQLLIERGANVNHADYDGDTALMFAAYKGHTEIVNALLVHGASVNRANKNRDTALIAAAKNGHTEIVTALLSHLQMDEISAKNKQNQTASDLANNDEIKELIKARANQRFKTTKSARNT